MGEPQWSDDSYLKKEQRKWEKPYRFEKFPQMLYKTMENPLSGKHEVSIARDVISADKTVVILSAEQFNSSCQLIVNDEQDYERARNDGWRDSQKEALAFYEGLQQDIARAAAERNYSDRNMSQGAKAEINAAEDSTAEHVAEVKEKRRAAMAKARAAKAAKKVTPEPVV